MKFTKDFRLCFLLWSSSEAGRSRCSPLSSWKLPPEIRLPHIPVISKIKDLEAKIFLSLFFSPKSKQFLEQARTRAGGEKLVFFSVHNFSDKTQRFQRHFHDKLYPYLWNFCKCGINHVHLAVICLEISFYLSCWQSEKQFLFANAAFSLVAEKMAMLGGLVFFSSFLLRESSIVRIFMQHLSYYFSMCSFYIQVWVI